LGEVCGLLELSEAQGMSEKRGERALQLIHPA
jgi:hypothetical protein